MKTKKFSFALVFALFAGLMLWSCDPEIEIVDKIVDEVDITDPVDGYAVKISILSMTQDGVEADEEGGWGYAYTKDGQGNETEIWRAMPGDDIFLNARAFQNNLFYEWFVVDGEVTIENSTSDVDAHFTMPEGDVEIGVMFGDNTYVHDGSGAILAKIDTDKILPVNAAVRAWKDGINTNFGPQCFVWFDSWSGRLDLGAGSMRSLPKEVTLIGMWGQPKFGLNEYQKADMKYAQEVLGSKVVFTILADKPGKGLTNETDPKWTLNGSTASAENIAIIRMYAKELYEACIAEGYDGFDLDYEPSYSTTDPLWEPPLFGVFMYELSYYFGRYAMDASRDRDGRAVPSKRLLFVVDGQVDSTDKFTSSNTNGLGWCVDYYICQAYGEANPASRVNGILTNLSSYTDKYENVTEKIGRMIMTENFESYADTGGFLQTMAALTVQGVPVGFGVYRIAGDWRHTGQEYEGSPNWVYLRRAIDTRYGHEPYQN